jgi:hypothetical protein
MNKKTKHIIFVVIIIVISWIVIESTAFLAYWTKFHNPYSIKKIKDEIKLQADIELKSFIIKGLYDVTWLKYNVVEVIHPFFGFVPDPYRNENMEHYKFLTGSEDPVMKRTEDKLIVGVFGGSFALGTYGYSSQVLSEWIQTTPATTHPFLFTFLRSRI